jgi:hypothetical protein
MVTRATRDSTPSWPSSAGSGDSISGCVGRDAERASFGARIVRVLRWQEQNVRQAWLFAAGYGLVSGFARGAVTSHFEGSAHGAVRGLVFGGGGVIVFGLGRWYRLRQRQAAQDHRRVGLDAR